MGFGKCYNTSMVKRAGFFHLFILFLLFSFILLLLEKNPLLISLRGSAEKILLPLQRATYSSAFTFTTSDSSEIKELRMKNADIAGQLAKLKAIERENTALHDQFVNTKFTPTQLMPANIIGLSSFIPGIAMPTTLTIDKGSSDGLKVGMITIYKDNLVGSISRVSLHEAIVMPIGSQDMSITARDSQTNALGILKGQGNSVMILENVVLSDKLTEKDIVVTKGSSDDNSLSYPPDIVIGTIVSINKKPSNLFQTAEVKSLINIPELTTIFVMMITR